MLASVGASAALLAAPPALAQAQTPQAFIQQALGDGQPFDAGTVTEMARQLAKRPFQAPPNDLPDVFANLNYDQYVGIRPRQAFQIWGARAAASPSSRCIAASSSRTRSISSWSRTVRVRRVAYDRVAVRFRPLNVPPTVGDIGYSGFRLLADRRRRAAHTISPSSRARPSSAPWRAARTSASIARALTLKPAETPRRGVSVLPRLLARTAARRQQRHHDPCADRLRIDHRRRPHDACGPAT